MMTAPTRSPGYWPTAALVLLALCPGLINSRALSLLSPTIAASLTTSPTDVAWVGLLGNAAYALGALVAADLTQRFPSRPVFLAGLALFSASSLACAVAPALSLLIAARILQGFAAGLLAVVAISPLLLGYPARRLPISVMLLVLGLFGAATLGPLVGGVVEQTESWRWLFALNGVLGCLILPVAADVATGNLNPVYLQYLKQYQGVPVAINLGGTDGFTFRPGEQANVTIHIHEDSSSFQPTVVVGPTATPTP
jgi:MFS family permease